MHVCNIYSNIGYIQIFGKCILCDFDDANCRFQKVIRLRR